jgi:hypothetical protein
MPAQAGRPLHGIPRRREIDCKSTLLSSRQLDAGALGFHRDDYAGLLVCIGLVEEGGLGSIELLQSCIRCASELCIFGMVYKDHLQ